LRLPSSSFAAPAQAQTTIGQLAPPSPDPYCINGPYDGAPIGTAAPTYTAPFSGLVTSWSTNATAGLGQEINFKIYKSLGGGFEEEHFLVVGQSGPQALVPSVLNTFNVSLPIQAGDVIALDDDNAIAVPNACLFQTGNPADLVTYTEGDAPNGTMLEAEGHEEGVRFNVTATILGPPAITSITPAAGSIEGGTSVVLAGSDFAQVSGVNFGSVSAKSFAVSSEGQITAVSPPSKTLGKVAITVTNSAGTGTSTQLFSYQGCKVPKLTGKKLKAAKKRLRKADCKLGKVKKQEGATGKTGKVSKQKPKSGKLLAPGSKVNVILKP